MKGFQELFGESAELRESLSEFYAVVIEFCNESLQFLNKNCEFIVSRASCFLRLTGFLQAFQQFTGLLRGNPFDFEKFEKQLGHQREAIILQQSLAAAQAAQHSGLQMSLFQQRGEHWDDEIQQWARNKETAVRTAVEETST